ncbi:polysaccharide deacetylase family protein [Paenibacillus pini]|uniref:Peptidoglycan N-acetylglucosamine deacetylase n=1 Tax=Paenibacillus pini JCM 16418 TaxID=1236976 RepID=W7YS39_9BACL|nr:polysaccharide deacetylase family protein [Paenibacillus pini]GAF07491.1 peptidoglycan N-acetylglucosamine deacetylase [Paenibacillus pini JCM 16418]
MARFCWKLTLLLLAFSLFMPQVLFNRVEANHLQLVEPEIDQKFSVPVHKNDQTDQRSSKKLREKQIVSLGQLNRKYPETFIIHGPRLMQVALTFDDVPDPRFTPQILDVLANEKVKATFFVIGSRAQQHPRMVSRIAREGHIIGNHSYNHPQFHKVPLSAYQQQINRTEQIIDGIIGYKPALIRPPYGDITEPQLRWAKQTGYTVVNWNVDSLDWKGLNKEAVKKNIMNTAGQGSIILQHGGGGTGSDLSGTIAALPDIIRQLKKKGYTFVTLPEMLNIKKNK